MFSTLFFVPFANHSDTGETIYAQNNVFTMVLTSAVILIALYTTAQYKDRKKQLKLVKMILALTLSFFGAAHLAAHSDPLTFGIDALKESYATGMIAVKLALIAGFLAHRNIKKDEELVQSVDRLR